MTIYAHMAKIIVHLWRIGLLYFLFVYVKFHKATMEPKLPAHILQIKRNCETKQKKIIFHT